VKRREFITLLGGTAAAWSANARAQQQFERMGRIGVLMNLSADDPESVARVAAFQESLRDLGWIVGRNIQMDVRWAPGNFGDNRKYAAELVALAPDAIPPPRLPLDPCWN
jgi:putative tryptophan/tyrosine transport system substrate-binding protein